MNSVFILGAGASAHAGVPVMKDFLEVIEDIHRSASKNWIEYPVFDLVVRARGELAAVQSKARFDIRNLESVFAAFEMAAIFGELGNLEADDVTYLMIAIRRAIVLTIERQMVLEVAHGDILPPHEYDYFGAVIRELLEKGERASIITFNYDVGLDLGLSRHDLAIDYCLDNVAPEGALEIEVMKLHGSINWTECLGCHNKIEVYDVREAVRSEQQRFAETGIPHRTSVNFSSRVGDLKHCENGHCDPDPVLVPPTANKVGFHKLLEPVWRRAAQRLREADNIFVLGYSWPNSDQFFRELYALGTVGTHVLRKFWVLNPDPTVKDRIRSELLGQQATDRFGGHDCPDPAFGSATPFIAERVFGLTRDQIGARQRKSAGRKRKE